MSTIYESLSEERKRMQALGEMPEFYTTSGWQLFKTKYLWEARTPNEQYRRIARTLARHAKSKPSHWGDRNWEDEFYKLMVTGWVSLSTPLLSNTGTERGFPVSCSGNVIKDNIQEIYKTRMEIAALTKYGFGTATDLSEISPRGTITRRGVKCSGVVPIIKGIVQDMDYTSQGSNRRGSWAGYLDIMHKDFYEVCALLESTPDSLNVGWIVKDSFIEAIPLGGEELNRYQTALKVKMTTGKGYFFFVDKANRHAPQWFKDKGLKIRASQLCVAPETLVLTDKGYKVIKDLENTTITVWNGYEWSKAYVKKTSNGQKLTRVKTNLGKELYCTDYHKFYVNRSGHSVETICLDLQPGDELLTWVEPYTNEFITDIVDRVERDVRYDATYCVNEPSRHLVIFNGILTGNCTEIMLPSDYEHTYTCILSSMNASKYDEWEGTDAAFVATVMLDCTASEFIAQAKGIVGLEKAVAYTEKARSLGLGVCGFHTYLQKHMMPFNSFEAYLFNQTLFKEIREQADEATRWMAKEWGEPEWCVGYGVRNSHLIAVAPTKSTSLIMGGISEGINPDPAYVYTQQTPAGEVNRVNPVLLQLMKDRGVYDSQHVQEIVDNQGSVQTVSWLSDHEKEIFKTAFEINQKDIIRLAAARQRYIDQGQSLNLFFSADESESYISEVHKEAFLNEDILSLYYCYSKAGVQASKGECSVCQ